MRITFNMMANKYKNNVASSLSAISQAQDKVTNKRNLLNPEDNTASYISAFSVQRMIEDLNQFSVNGENASTWLTNADNALQEIYEIISDAKNTCAIGGASDQHDATSRKALADQVLEIYQTLVDLANTTSMGQYIFSGFETATKPFQKGTNVVSAITSLDNNGGDISVKSVFSDLPELQTGKYTAKVTVKNGIGTLQILDALGTKMILDSNGGDESGTSGNGTSTELTFKYEPGAIVNTGRGISVTMPKTNETALTLTFNYQAGSEMNYMGDFGSIITQIGYNQDVPINVAGGNIFTQTFKTIESTRTNTVNGLAATLSSYFSQIDGANSNIGDSIKISGTDHMGNPVGSASVLAPVNTDLKLSDASEKERTILLGYGDKMYKVVVPQDNYASTDDLAAVINSQLKNAEYVGPINLPKEGYTSMEAYSSAVHNMMLNGHFKGEDTEADRAKFYTDISGEINIRSEGDRLQFVTGKTGNNVRLTVTGYEQNMLGFNSLTVGSAGKDTVFEIGYPFDSDNVGSLQTTLKSVNLGAGGNSTFYINGNMVNVNFPAITTTPNTVYTGATLPTAGGADLAFNVTSGGVTKTIQIPLADFYGNYDEKSVLTVINNALQEAGFYGVHMDSYDPAAGDMTLVNINPPINQLEKQAEYAFDTAIRASGLGFGYGVKIVQDPSAPSGRYNITFTMNNNNIGRDTILNTTYYNTNTLPASSYMESATPNRFGVNLAKEQSFSQLADFIKNLYGDAVSVNMKNGKLIVEDLRSGSSRLNINVTGINQGVSHPTDQLTVMGGRYLGAKDDEWQVKVNTVITSAGQRDIRIVIKDSSGFEIYDQLTENYLGGEIMLPYGVTITPNTYNLPDPLAPAINERTTEFDIKLTAKGNIGFGDMTVTEEGKNINIFRSLVNLANALTNNITKNGFSEPSAWKDETLTSTASPYFDGVFRGTFNDVWTFVAEQANGKNDVFLQNEFIQETGEIKYDNSLINKLGSVISFGIDLYDNITGEVKRCDINIDLSSASPAVTDSLSARQYILKELNSNWELLQSGVRFTEQGGKIRMESGSGTKIASFANTALGNGKALASSLMGFDILANNSLNDAFPMTLAANADIYVNDIEASNTAVLSPDYPARKITIPAGTYDTRDDLALAINNVLDQVEPNGTNGRLTVTFDANGALQFINRESEAVESFIDTGTANPFGISLERGAAGFADIFASASQSPITDLSETDDAGRTLQITYHSGTPVVKRTTIVTLDKRAYDSAEELANAINSKLRNQGVNPADMKAALTNDGRLVFTGSNGNVKDIVVEGDEEAALGFTKAGDEAKIKVTGSDGSLVQEITLDTANKTFYISDGLYLGFDKGSLKATDAFTGAVGSGVENEIDVLEQAEKQILSATTLVGNRAKRVESVATFQTTLIHSAEKAKANYLGSTELDQVAAATDLQMAKSAYEAALASTSKLLSLSLLDYLS